MSKKLGLDIGTNSLGWFVNDNGTVTHKGAITFHPGMIKGKLGYLSAAKERTKARNCRIQLNCKRTRKQELLNVLIEANNNFVPINNTQLLDWTQYQKGKTQKFPPEYLIPHM